jgi:beta-lactamase class A
MQAADRLRFIFPYATVFLIGLGLGYYIFQNNLTTLSNAVKSTLVPIQEQGTAYKFVHPLLAYRTPEATVLGDYISLKAALQSTVDAASADGTSRAAVYFRDLDAALWVGINQTDTYYPASLLKVPTMMAFYQESEDNPGTFDQTIIYDPSVLPSIPFDTPSVLTPGQPYTVQNLMRHMIIDSDNGATFTLLAHINPEFLHQVYVALGIQDPGDNSANYTISARTYALFFRILYNASYLTGADSERALKLLSEATFTKGLVAGVPAGTVVAHKFGEHVLSSGNTATGVELSDCGIVYYPKHPYLLCVMTSAVDEAVAEATIATISSQTYAAVSARYATSTPSK